CLATRSPSAEFSPPPASCSLRPPPSAPMSVSTPLLELQNGSVVFGGGALSRITTVAVDNVSFQFHEQPPRILSMVGESGSGKTTIARCLLGLAEPTGGRVLWRGKDICRLSSDEFRTYRREVQAVF